MEFQKYQGTGNDFVMIDNRTNVFDKTNLELVTKLCDRKFGIGADGLILIENHPEVDFEMIYFNADGTKSFCGNGSRCAVSFANKLGIIELETKFIAIDGIHEAKIVGKEVHLKMGDISKIETGKDYYFLDTGSPHYIKYKNNISEIDIIKSAHKIRYNERFSAEGTNVNFVEKQSNSLKMRTYERGVEDETLSCGTGATAVALSASLKLGMDSPIKINVPGGELKIKFTKINETTFEYIWLIGPAEFVFEGEI